jgi:hypothetical protein
MNLHPDTHVITRELLSARILELDEEVNKRKVALDNVLGALTEVKAMKNFLDQSALAAEEQARAANGHMTKAMENLSKQIGGLSVPVEALG